MSSLRVYSSTRYRGGLLEIHFARYTVESCSVINFMSLLPIVECSYLTTRCARSLYNIKDRQYGVQHPHLARAFSPSSLFLTRMLACTYSVTLEKRIITRKMTNIGETEFVTNDFMCGKNHAFARMNSLRV